MDITALAIGFFIGVIVVFLAIEIGMRRAFSGSPKSKHAKKWDINEITNPRIMAEYLMDGVTIPQGSKVIVNQYKNKDNLQGIQAKKHGGIRGNYIIGDDRVLILSGPFKNDEFGVWTVEKDIVEKLNQEFEDKWDEASSIKFEEKK